MAICSDCHDRDAVPNKRQCRPCLQRRSVHLGDKERELLVKFLCDAAAQADQELQMACLAAANRLQNRISLGQESRSLCIALVDAWCVGHERDHGTINPAAEHLYRRLTKVDRRTGEGPPWPLLLDAHARP